MSLSKEISKNEKKKMMRKRKISFFGVNIAAQSRHVTLFQKIKTSG